MKILDVTKKYEEIDIIEYANEIKNGNLVIFPTETVYGIGTNGLNKTAVNKIYEVKNRPYHNPINLLVKDIAMIESITTDISALEYKLMQAFFPGPFTIILKRNQKVPDIITNMQDTVGVRISNHPIVKKLIGYANVPIAAPSANISGTLSGTDFQYIKTSFHDKVYFLIYDGMSPIGIESTIVKVIDETVHILRPGTITVEDIKKITPNIILEENILKNKTSEHIKSNKEQHYQLEANSLLVYSSNYNEMIARIKKEASNYHLPTILCCDEHKDKYIGFNTITYGSIHDLNEIARNIFHQLYQASKQHPDIILIEGIKKEGLGIALMNRLLHVCNFNEIEI